MLKYFNIESVSDLNEFYENVYKPHLELVHKLPQTKKTKSTEKMALLLGHNSYGELLSHLDKKQNFKASTLEDKCLRCGYPIDSEGFCTTELCIYSEWLQDTTWIESDDAWTPTNESKKTKKKINVSATFKLDDSDHEVEFDSARYFNSLSEKELTKAVTDIHNAGYMNDYPLDEVAYYFEDSDHPFDEDIKASITFARSADCGFECKVDADELAEWLKAFRNRAYLELKDRNIID